MKMACVWTFLLLGLATAASTVAKPAKAAPAPAAAEKKDEEPPTMETLRIKFEIENFNYFDLTKESCPEKVVKKHHHHKKHHKKAKADKDALEPAVTIAPPMPMPEVPKELPEAPVAMGGEAKGDSGKLPWMRKDAQKKAPPPPPPAAQPRVDMAPAIDAVHANTDAIANGVKDALGANQAQAVKPPWMQKKEAKKSDAPSFLQVSSGVGACIARKDFGETKSTECTTVMDVLRDTIKDTVRDIVRCLYLDSLKAPAGPGPAAALPAAPAGVPVAFLAVNGPAAAPAPGPAGPPPPPEMKIFVTFTPGRKIGSGRSTMVEITFLDTPGNTIDDVKTSKPFLVWCMNNGLFDKELGDALEQVTKITPDMHGEKMDTEKVEQWNIKKCEKHIRSIVDEFTHHYTRRQVPMALYNECTNFMTRMSFSHDYVLDPQDTIRCRRATRNFATHWNYGKKTEEKDFEEMCHNACEAKYGRKAPTCNVKEGDGLLGQPL